MPQGHIGPARAYSPRGREIQTATLFFFRAARRTLARAYYGGARGEISADHFTTTAILGADSGPRKLARIRQFEGACLTSERGQRRVSGIDRRFLKPSKGAPKSASRRGGWVLGKPFQPRSQPRFQPMSIGTTSFSGLRFQPRFQPMFIEKRAVVVLKMPDFLG